LSGQKSGKSKTRENTQKRAYLAQNYQLVFKNSACFGGGAKQAKTSRNKPSPSPTRGLCIICLYMWPLAMRDRSMHCLCMKKSQFIFYEYIECGHSSSFTMWWPSCNAMRGSECSELLDCSACTALACLRVLSLRCMQQCACCEHCQNISMCMVIHVCKAIAACAGRDVQSVRGHSYHVHWETSKYKHTKHA
jgi:hypothetical protein